MAVLKLHPDPDEPELIAFFSALGMCVSSWAHVDRRLFELYHRASGKPLNQAGKDYYKHTAFSRRLKTVDKALKVALSDAYFKQNWRALRGRIKTLALTRNILAHSPAKRTARSVDGKPAYIYTIHIEPYQRIAGIEFGGLPEKGELDIADLEEHDRLITELERDLRLFLDGLPSLQSAQ